MVTENNPPWSDWIEEEAIIQSDSPGLSRLSVYGIREVLYLGTSLGNHSLAFATTNGGLTSYFKFAPEQDLYYSLIQFYYSVLRSFLGEI